MSTVDLLHSAMLRRSGPGNIGEVRPRVAEKSTLLPRPEQGS